MNITTPDTWNSLIEYTNWYKSAGYPIRIPVNAKVYTTEHTFSITVFKQREYVTELYLVKPNTTSPKHFHTAEQACIFLGGCFSGRASKDLNDEPSYKILGGNNVILPKNNSDLPHPEAGTIEGPLPLDWWHQLVAGDSGFAFFVCQKWPTSETTSAVVDWQGPSIGTEHEKLLSG